MKRALLDFNFKPNKKKTKKVESEHSESEISDISLRESTTSPVDTDKDNCMQWKRLLTQGQKTLKIAALFQSN